MSRGGADYALSCGDYTAAVSQVGGGLRMLRWRDRDLVLPYAADDVRPRHRGALLAPWPNRIADGRYSFRGTSYQLALSEPERATALHGLICWVRFEVVDRSSTTVTLRHRLVAQTGYPFELEITTDYALAEDGLRCTVTARNTGLHAAPYGVAPHPYLLGGAGPLDDWTLRFPAAQVLQVTPDRLLPRTLIAAAALDMDFRTPRMINALEIDHAFTGLAPDPDGRVRVRVVDTEASGVELEWDPRVLPWLQLHTADLPAPQVSRIALAVEPMTCPPDAFNSTEDLVVLDSGSTHTASWTYRAIA